MPSLEVVEAVLVQCNTNKNLRYNDYLLNVEPSNLVFLKTYDTEFMDQNGRPLETENKLI